MSESNEARKINVLKDIWMDEDLFVKAFLLAAFQSARNVELSIKDNMENLKEYWIQCAEEYNRVYSELMKALGKEEIKIRIDKRMLKKIW